jgi:basic membrane protein A
MEKGIVDISPMSEKVPEQVRGLVAAKKAAIVAGAFEPFTGEIKDQSGAVRIPSGKSAADPELLGMDWFVRGVVGSTQ